MTGILLALGLVVTAATQFRMGGLPIGPGELMLLGWMGLAAMRYVLLARTLRLSPAFRRVAIFWLAMVFSLCVGMIMGLVVEPFQFYSGMFRDAAAYSLVLIFSLLVTLSLEDATERRRVIWNLVILGSVSLTLQIADGFGLVPLPGVTAWYWDRLRGWAENPNQLGFFALVVTLLSLHLAESARNASETLRAIAFAVPPFIAGMMSKSDSFIIGIMLSGALFVTLKSIIWIRTDDMAPTLKGTAVVLALMALPLTIVASIPFASAAFERFEEISEGVYGENDQGEVRLHLWAEAVDKGLEAKLLGLGPGPHLTSKSFKRPPPNKFEVHNTFLDLFTQGGIVSVMAFFWITGLALIGAARAPAPALAGLVVGLLVFSMFHYTVRHPIFWFGIVLCLLEAAQRSRRKSASIPKVRAHSRFIART